MFGRSGTAKSQEIENNTKKKTKGFREQDPEKVKEYQEAIASSPHESIIYIDETGVDRYIYREYCRSKRGKKVIGRISGKRFKRTGIAAAMRGKEIIAPLQYDGTMDNKLFEFWFSSSLLPALPKNSTIVMDNASFHRKSKLFSLPKTQDINSRSCRHILLNLTLLNIFGLGLKVDCAKYYHFFRTWIRLFRTVLILNDYKTNYTFGHG